MILQTKQFKNYTILTRHKKKMLECMQNLGQFFLKELKSKYVQFPSISICLDQDVKKQKLGFKKVRPLNETLRDLTYVRHFNNGYVNVF